jgi:hypothetical protein
LNHAVLDSLDQQDQGFMSSRSAASQNQHRFGSMGIDFQYETLSNGSQVLNIDEGCTQWTSKHVGMSFHPTFT